MSADKFMELDTNRIRQISAMLPDKPVGFGKPCSDRRFWRDMAKRSDLSKVVKQAESYLTAPMPRWSDEDYLEFSRNGNRTRGQAMQSRRSSRLYPLVIAECLENKGRFTNALNDALNEYVSEPTWSYAAHDQVLRGFRLGEHGVDLRSSGFAFDLAQALYLPGDKISPETRKRVADALEQRIFAPFRKSLETGQNHWWLGNRKSNIINNWNPVCLAGVIGAALSSVQDRNERAIYVAAGEHYSQYYMNSFTDDGYCDEGASYWAYGFGSFVNLRDILLFATSGKIDLLSHPKVRNAASYASRIQIFTDSAPAFADSRFGRGPDRQLADRCNYLLGIDSRKPTNLRKGLALLFIEPIPCESPAEAGTTDDGTGLRSYFEDVGVLVCRPAPRSRCRVGAAIKAGGNRSHSHNDIGSFVIALGTNQPVGEVGGPQVYDRQTFSPDRYKLRLINSFGHPVPVIAGRLQVDATRVHPKVVATNFTDGADEISIDMTCAYDAPELRKLVRTMKYSRQGEGSVTITDRVSFSPPADYELGLPTNGQWKQIDDKTLEFSINDKSVTARIDTPDGFEVTCETIDEQGKPPFPRVGIKLRKPVKEAVISVVFAP